MALPVILNFLESPELGAGLKVRRYDLRDAMGELFELTIELLSADPQIDDRNVVGQPVVVTFDDEPLLEEVRGIVWEMKQETAVIGGDSRYILTVAPSLRLTTQRHDHRIFQNQSVPQMIEEVLGGYAGRIDVPVQYGADDAESWEYTVQYRETDWQFIRRILGTAGFATFFDHANGSCWTLVDDTTTDLPEGGPAIPFFDQTLLKAPDDGTPYVLAMASQRAIRTSRVSLRDYNYENPAAKAEGADAMKPEDSVENEPDLEHYEFNVDYFTDEDAGNSYAKLRRQGLRTGVRLVTCTTNFTISTGSRMTVEGHPTFDGEYLVVRAHAVVDDGGERRHELVLMDADQPWLPPVHRQPRIHGVQTAVVVGAPGKEIDVDELGRVLLRFRWDRRDPESGAPTRRVRVGQGWSGTDRGIVTIPRVGDELLVAYYDGDPANPMVVGRVHNAASASPLNLPAQAAVSLWRGKSTPGGGGFNEIRMDDTAGSEMLSMHAQRDHNVVVLRDAQTIVGQHETRVVQGNRTMSVKGNQADSVGGDKTIEVSGALNLQGKTMSIVADTEMDIHSGAHMQITSDTDRDDDTAGNHKIEATGALFLKSDGVVQLVAPKIHAFGGDEIHLQVGGSSIHITAGGIKITSAGEVEVNGALVKLNC